MENMLRFLQVTYDSFKTMKQRVLCIEDDPTIQTLVEASLLDFEVVPAFSLKEAESKLSELNFAALLIDIQLPDGDGLRFLTKLVADPKYKKIPVLILSNQVAVSNKVLAFSLGAEDFVGKPFDPIELNARVTSKVKKRNAETEEAQTRKLGNVLIDFTRHKAFMVAGGTEKDLGLTGIELKILSLLTRRLEQVYTREQIIDQVWGETYITDRTVDSHMAHLRQKIQETSLSVETAKGLGYRAIVKK
jgi:two-component system phosphate regulon response regulator PhoB